MKKLLFISLMCTAIMACTQTGQVTPEVTSVDSVGIDSVPDTLVDVVLAD